MKKQESDPLSDHDLVLMCERYNVQKLEELRSDIKIQYQNVTDLVKQADHFRSQKKFRSAVELYLHAARKFEFAEKQLSNIGAQDSAYWWKLPYQQGLIYDKVSDILLDCDDDLYYQYNYYDNNCWNDIRGFGAASYQRALLAQPDNLKILLASIRCLINLAGASAQVLNYTLSIDDAKRNEIIKRCEHTIRLYPNNWQVHKYFAITWSIGLHTH